MKKTPVLFLVLIMGIEVSSFSQREPSCACNPAETVMSLAGKNLVYSELSINILYDNSILIKDGESGMYYKIKSGVQKGPLSEDDPELSSFINQVVVPADYNPLYTTYKEFIFKTGDKYQIKFKGTVYGPYYDISSFYVTRSGDKFMAMVSEKEPFALKVEKLNQKITSATTEEEKQALQVQHLKLIQEEMESGGDVMNNIKMISNVPGAKYDLTEGLAFFNTDSKYDEIVKSALDDKSQLSFFTLSGAKLITINPEQAILGDQVFINSANTRYAIYGNGTITFNDGTSKSDLFNPFLTRIDGKIYLAYLYYSPSRNAIMQCKIPF